MSFESHDALLRWARGYAHIVDLDVNLDSIDWEVSTRAKRRAGACRFDRETGEITVRLAWRAAESFSLSELKAVVRHELIHAWEYQEFGEAGHGSRFKRQAARLDVATTCPRFSDGRLRLTCENDACDWVVHRHRASASVTQPERRRCGDCGARYEVEHVASGETWTTTTGYETARARIEEW
ncbi:SprT-like domain-containing protein [Natronomonas sp. EA1]|uniref:SprT-like domain-containing protein n=1 Tax=Natronomonas sp. EA1 TaxID=3421655 RepID=UPI003EB98014